MLRSSWLCFIWLRYQDVKTRRGVKTWAYRFSGPACESELFVGGRCIARLYVALGFSRGTDFVAPGFSLHQMDTSKLNLVASVSDPTKPQHTPTSNPNQIQHPKLTIAPTQPNFIHPSRGLREWLGMDCCCDAHVLCSFGHFQFRSFGPTQPFPETDPNPDVTRESLMNG